MSTRAQIRQRETERIIKNPNNRTNGNPDKKSAEKPKITAKALITIPRPMF